MNSSVNVFSFDSRIGDKDFPLRVKRMSPQDNTSMHSHQFTELVLIYEGEGTHHTLEGQRQVATGDVLVIPKGESHRYDNVRSLCLVNIIFEADLMPMPILDAASLPGFHVLFTQTLGSHAAQEIPILVHRLAANELDTLCDAAAELEAELSELKPGYQFSAISLFMRIVLKLSRIITPIFYPKAHSSGEISNALAYLHKHFKEKPTIEEAAAQANMSTSTLLRRFKHSVGCTPKEYQMRLRIKHACWLLYSTDLNMSEIADQCGFLDSNHFSRMFKHMTKTSPREYRLVCSAKHP